MKVCKYCGCEYDRYEDKYESIKDSMACRVISPSWVIDKTRVEYPIKPFEVLSICPCPCHWRHDKNKKGFIEAVKEIIGSEF